MQAMDATARIAFAGISALQSEINGILKPHKRCNGELWHDSAPNPLLTKGWELGVVPMKMGCLRIGRWVADHFNIPQEGTL